MNKKKAIKKPYIAFPVKQRNEDDNLDWDNLSIVNGVVIVLNAATDEEAMEQFLNEAGGTHGEMVCVLPFSQYKIFAIQEEKKLSCFELSLK